MFRLFQDRNNEQLDYLADVVNNSVEIITSKGVRKLEIYNKKKKKKSKGNGFTYISSSL